MAAEKKSTALATVDSFQIVTGMEDMDAELMEELEDEMDQFTDVDFMSYTKAIIFSMFYTKIDTLHSPELTLNSLSLKEKYEKYSKIHTENSDKVIGIWSTLLSYKNKYVLQLITMMRENKFKCEMVSTSDEESFDIKIKLDI